MLVVVLITFAVTWLPSMLMEILRYSGNVRPKGKLLMRNKIFQ